MGNSQGSSGKFLHYRRRLDTVQRRAREVQKLDPGRSVDANVMVDIPMTRSILRLAAAHL